MSNMTNKPVVLPDVCKTYRVGEVDVPAVKGLSFEIPQQRFSVIVGPSGSGKTALLHPIGWIEKPRAGQVMVPGQDVATRSDNPVSDVRAQKVGFVFQNVRLIPLFSADEHRAKNQP